MPLTREYKGCVPEEEGTNMAGSLPVWQIIGSISALIIFLLINWIERLRIENFLLHQGWVQRGDLWYPDGWSGRPGFGPDDDYPGLDLDNAYYWQLRFITPPAQLEDEKEQIEHVYRRH